MVLFSPSIRHRLAAEVIRRTRRAGDIGDLATFRARFLAANAREPRRVPADFVELPDSRRACGCSSTFLQGRHRRVR